MDAVCNAGEEQAEQDMRNKEEKIRLVNESQ